MSWRTSSPVVAARVLGRAFGLNQRLSKAVSRGTYEDRFQVELMTSVRQGDVVWDVGANVGHYSRLLSGRVGPTGVIVAWEPSSTNAQQLRNAVAALTNVVIVEAALGEAEGMAAFQQGTDAFGASSRIVDCSAGNAIGPTLQVQVLSGDAAIASLAVPEPTVVKIDVEGFELETLRGLRETLTRPSLRSVCVEVHFAILHQRRIPHAAAEIERLLNASGFVVRWADLSHIAATREM